MRRLQFVLAALLALGGTGHLVGTLTGYPPGSEVFVWSLTAVCYVYVLVFLHVLRISRPDDRPVMVAATIATLAWLVLALAFGAAIGNIADPRALTQAGISAALLVTTFLTRGRRNPVPAGADT
jgi:hypothetical protein